MKRHNRLVQFGTAAALAAVLSFPQAVLAAGQPIAVSASTTAALAADESAAYSSFLSRHYGIALSGTVNRAQFAAALEKVVAPVRGITAEPTQTSYLPQAPAGSTSLTVWEAVTAAVKAAEQKELAYTYDEAKVAAAWAKAGWTYNAGGTIPFDSAQELAVAIDLQFVPALQLASLKADGSVSAELAYQLLGKVAEFHGQTQNYLGTISEAGIYGKLVQAWKESQLIKAGDLQQLVDEVLKQDLITGYNLKDAAFDPHFDPARTITYGHSDIVHAVQLIGLLQSEGIEAKVQLEPKTSAFLYLKEWGEPTETEDYQVVQIENGNYIAYSKEYDLSFEFASAEEKERFQPLVLQYAKKNEEDATGLLKGSWWQPLYYSLTEIADYPVITNNYVQEGRYIVQTFSLNEDSAAVVEGFKTLDATLDVQTYQFWVDQPFYNYLLGDFK
ncbi:hypothetical protein ACAF76_009550 [Brevibacillus sp. TJ4]|uniref:hypothetical protein n=1 Tax=Brevibacillus sp. TJ4 TaxID=3234853 RepID=UPI003B9E210B